MLLIVVQRDDPGLTDRVDSRVVLAGRLRLYLDERTVLNRLRLLFELDRHLGALEAGQLLLVELDVLDAVWFLHVRRDLVL